MFTIQNYEKSTKENTDEFFQKEIQSITEQVADDFYNACLHTYMNKYTYQSIVTVSGAGELTINGKPLTTTTTGVVRQINPKGEDKPALENPLITDMERTSDVAEWATDYFAKRNLISVPYRGSPELDANDLIYLESQFNPYFPIRLMELSLTYNGGLSGKIKAVMI